MTAVTENHRRAGSNRS